MIGFILESIINLLLAFVNLLGGCVASDTVAGTSFVYPKAVKQRLLLDNNNNNSSSQQKLLQQQRNTTSNNNNNNNISRAGSVVPATPFNAADFEKLLQSRRIQICKYFFILTAISILAALAAWDRWPLLWLLRFQCFIVSFCALVKGPDEILRNDFLRIPLTIVPWMLAIDFLLLSS